MSDHESRAEDARVESAEDRARRRRAPRVNSATEEPPFLDEKEFDAQLVVAPRGYTIWEAKREGRHLLAPDCWCGPVLAGNVLRHRDSPTTKTWLTGNWRP